MPALRDSIESQMKQLQQQATALATSTSSSSSRSSGPSQPPAAGPEWDKAMGDVNGGLQKIVSMLEKLLQVYEQVRGVGSLPCQLGICREETPSFLPRNIPHCNAAPIWWM
jgi:hypothetical protein